jgi:hypothetical protein
MVAEEEEDRVEEEERVAVAEEEAKMRWHKVREKSNPLPPKVSPMLRVPNLLSPLLQPKRSPGEGNRRSSLCLPEPLRSPCRQPRQRKKLEGPQGKVVDEGEEELLEEEVAKGHKVLQSLMVQQQLVPRPLRDEEREDKVGDHLVEEEDEDLLVVA